MTTIAVVQYNWAVQGYTRDLVVGLADHGYQVLFFIDHKSLHSGLIDLQTLHHPNITLHLLQGIPYYAPRSFGRRVYNRLFWEIGSLINSPFWLVSQNGYRSMVQQLKSSQYFIKAIIGIEKLGLVLAGAASQATSIPYLYYSLELLFRDVTPHRFFQKTFELERKYHQGALATIVQDESRGNALFSHNGISNQTRIYFPVSVGHAPTQQPSNYWHQRFNLSSGHRVVLYFGMVGPTVRGLKQIVEIWRNCTENTALVLHGGRGDAAGLRNYCETLAVTNVFVSGELVKEGRIPDLIRSADIGLCIYGNEAINERLTAFSSQKIALYLREGVPIISNSNESYDRLYSWYRCGEAITDYTDLPAAVGKILSSHQSYRREARQAFERFYTFENNLHALTSYLESV